MLRCRRVVADVTARVHDRALISIATCPLQQQQPQCTCDASNPLVTIGAGSRLEPNCEVQCAAVGAATATAASASPPRIIIGDGVTLMDECVVECGAANGSGDSVGGGGDHQLQQLQGAHADRNAVRIGSGSVVGVRAQVRGGAVLGRGCVVGAYAVVSEGCTLGDGCVVRPRTIVPPGFVAPPGSVLMTVHGSLIVC